MTMSLALKERFARQGAVKAIDRVRFGSPVALALTATTDQADVQVIPAALALVRRHVPMPRAKRSLEAVLEEGKAYIDVPVVEDSDALIADLLQAGVVAHPAPAVSVDVKEIRAKTGHTQEQFALRYRIDLATLRNWEQGRFQPDQAARNFLRLIASHPTEVEAMIWEG